MNKQHSELFKTAMQFRKLHVKGALFDMSHFDFCTLKTIGMCEEEGDKNGEKVKVSMISNKMHMNNTAVSRSLKALEADGLIERTVNTKDRRVTYVSLTDKGHKKLDEAKEAEEEFKDAVFNQIDEAQIEQLIELLNKIYDISAKELEKRRNAKKVIKEKLDKDEQNI